MFPIIKNKAWEEITQQLVIIVALISAANINVPWMQVGCLIGWGFIVLPMI